MGRRWVGLGVAGWGGGGDGGVMLGEGGAAGGEGVGGAAVKGAGEGGGAAAAAAAVSGLASELTTMHQSCRVEIGELSLAMLASTHRTALGSDVRVSPGCAEAVARPQPPCDGDAAPDLPQQP